MLILNFQEIKWLVAKKKIFVIDFVISILFVLTLVSDRAVLYGNIAFSIAVILTKKRCSVF